MAGPTPTTSVVPRLWRSEPQADPRARRGAERRRAIFTLQAAIMALTGAVVGMLYWISPAPKPRLVTLWVARHPSGRLPPPPQAARDLSALTALWAGPGFGPAEKPAPALDREGFESALRRISGATGRAATLVVYVRANAAVRPAPGVGDRVYLLPADADPAAPAAWLPLTAVLDALKKAGGDKLLVLDLNPLAVPRAGALGDDVAGAIPGELKGVPDPRRLVLTSCGPGERPLASEDLGRSAFAHALIEGLGGKADGFRGSADGAVTAAELASFVAARVDRWAVLNRGARQRPALLGDGRKDAPLIVLAGGPAVVNAAASASAKASTDALIQAKVGGAASPAAAELKKSAAASLKSAVTKAAPAPETAPAYPDWLAQAWAERDLWRKDGRARVAPWAYRTVQARLLQAEADWRNGSDESAEARLKADLAALTAAWAGPIAPPTGEAVRSLALDRSLGRLPDEAAARLAADVAALRRELTEGFASAKPEDAEASRKALIQKFLTDHKATPETVPVFARAVVKASADGTPSPTPEAVAALDRILKAALLVAGPDATPPVETLTLRRLADRAAAPPDAPGRAAWPTDSVHLALVLADRAAEVEGRPRAVPWVGRELSEAARLRHDAEVLLWEPAYAEPGETRAALTLAAGRFEAVAADARAVESALASLDRAFELLPATAALLDDLPALGEAWEAAAGRAAELAAMLEPAESPPPSAVLGPLVEAVALRTPALDGSLGTIETAVAEETARLSAAAPGTEAGPSETAGRDVRAIDALLASTLPTADARKALWLAADARSRALAEVSRARDLTADPAENPPEGDPSGQAGAEPEGDAGARGLGPRARRAVALLALAGIDPAAAKALDADARAVDGPDPEERTKAESRLPDELLARWNGLHETVRGADWRAADRVSRVLPALEPAPGLDAARNPTLRLRAADWDELWRRSADRLAVDAADLDGEAKLADVAARLRALGADERARVGLPARGPLANGRGLLSPFLGQLPEVGELSPERRATDLVVLFRKPEAGHALAAAAVGVDGRWLRVGPAVEPPGATSDVSTRRSFRVAVGPAPAGAAGAPPGFLLRAGPVGEGWDYHARVPVGLSLDATVPQVLVSADPESPTAPLGEIRLRPIPGVQREFVYLRNPADRPRKLSVELTAAGRPVPGSPWSVSLDRGDVRRLDFPLPPPTPVPPGTVAPPPIPRRPPRPSCPSFSGRSSSA